MSQRSEYTEPQLQVVVPNSICYGSLTPRLRISGDVLRFLLLSFSPLKPVGRRAIIVSGSFRLLVKIRIVYYCTVDCVVRLCVIMTFHCEVKMKAGIRSTRS